VVDNASYYNIREMKEPTSTTRKADLLLWLEDRQLPTDSKLTKPKLYSIIKEHKSQHRIYKLDLLMATYGHEVLRLLPYHPELNPIEKIWASVKNWVAVHNTTFKLKDVEQLARRRFSEITADNWAGICRYVAKLEDDHITRAIMLRVDEALEECEFVVNTSSSDEFWEKF
jgi:transposase